MTVQVSCSSQVLPETFRPNSTDSTWPSRWFWKLSKASLRTQSPTSRWRSPSMAGLALARTLWPGSLRTTCIATGWKASVSDCSLPLFISHMPDWSTRTRWEGADLVLLAQIICSHASGVLPVFSGIAARLVRGFCVYTVYEYNWSPAGLVLQIKYLMLFGTWLLAKWDRGFRVQ